MSWTRHFYQTATYSTFVLWYRKPSKRIPSQRLRPEGQSLSLACCQPGVNTGKETPATLGGLTAARYARGMRHLLVGLTASPVADGKSTPVASTRQPPFLPALNGGASRRI